MSDLAIRVENLGKRYRLGEARARYKTIRDSITSLLKGSLRRRPASAPEFWALRNLTFDIPRGSVIGIIGRNGAGKSTLLKILSNITAPTEGRALVYGSLNALLEVGTGFHPELTGRENIFLSGAIMGMSRADIRRRFDEIVSFAEVEAFLDTPCKHYSSGMYVRLAFSVAAHVEPDILVIDEVLAVGDANFQKKCLGKMEDVGNQGRTVLFVSHSMPTVLRLCRQAMLLEKGHVKLSGTPHQVVSEYLQTGTGTSGHSLWPTLDTAPGDQSAKLHAVRVKDERGNVVDVVDIRQPLTIEVDYWLLSATARPAVGLHLYNDEGVCLFITLDFNAPTWRRGARKPGLVRSICRIPGNFLAEGRIILRHVAVASYNPTVVHALVNDAVSFQVVDHSQGDGARGIYVGDIPGAVRPLLEWELIDGVEAE